MIRTWKKYRIVAAFAIIALAGGVAPLGVFAEGWEGIGTSVGGNNGDGETGGGCNNNGHEFLVGCAGVSWVFYKANAQTNEDTVLPYPIENNPIKRAVTADGRDAFIPAQCSKYKDGGFWSYGRNIMWGGYYANTSNGAVGPQNSITLRTIDGSFLFYGHIVALTWPEYANKDLDNPGVYYNTSVVDGLPLQQIGVYELDRAGTPREVLKAYNEYRRSEGKSDVTELPEGLYGFCWSPEMEKDTEMVGRATAGTSDTGYTNVNKQVVYGAKNCVGGCDVKLELSIKWNQGNLDANYKTRTSRNGTWTDWEPVAENDYNIAKKASGTEQTVKSGTERLLPGESVCYELAFLKEGNAGNIVRVTSCAFAEGSSEAKLGLTVKNENLDNEYKKEVYAKPGDKITYQVEYNPASQFGYGINTTIASRQTTIRCNNNEYRLNTGGALVGLVGQKCGTWRNAFSTQRSVNSGEWGITTKRGDYAAGSTNRETLTYEFDGDSKVGTENVGRNYEDRAILNVSNDVKFTPSKTEVSYKDNAYNMRAEFDELSSEVVSVKVPYNYNNSAVVKYSGDNVVYAGENKTIGFNFDIKEKANGATKGTYVTDVPYAKVYLRYCYNGTCTTTGEKEYRNISSSSSRADESVSVPIPDVKAGTTVTVSAFVYPSSSGSDTNWNDINGNYEWAESDTVTFVVGKKPSIQVWGGDVYSASSINLRVAVKRYADGVRVFGSWGELGVINSAGVTGFGSGASMGYASMDGNGTLTPSYNSNNGGLGVASYGGSRSNNECSRSLLTIPNQKNCKGTGGAGSSMLKNLINGNSGSIANTFGLDKTQPTSVTSTLISGGSANSTVYYYNNSNMTVTGASSLQDGTIYIAYSTNGNITINGNIEYPSKTYTTFANKPTIIIYAKNVNITCNVSRVDALIIAKGNVDTCSTGTNDVNNVSRSSQLIINGAVIANKLNAKRTYGAATGANSIIPAEIINFDPTLYLFGGETNSSGMSTNVELVRMREMAPRL